MSSSPTYIYLVVNRDSCSLEQGITIAMFKHLDDAKDCAYQLNVPDHEFTSDDDYKEYKYFVEVMKLFESLEEYNKTEELSDYKEQQ